MTILPTKPVPHTTTRLLTRFLQYVDGSREASPPCNLSWSGDR